MKHYLLLLSISASVYGIERSQTEHPQNKANAHHEIDLSKVKPLPLTPPQTPPQRLSDSSPQNQELSHQEPTNTSSIPWLGISGESISKELKTHLRLESGLIVKLVAQSSPASQAGLQENDIILSVNERPISTQQHLRNEILNCSPHQVITLNTIKAGEPTILSVKLAQKEKNRGRASSPFLHERTDTSPSQTPPRGFANRGFGKILKEMGFDRLMNEASPKNLFNFNLRSTSSVIISDPEGSVEITVSNDDKNVIVKDNSGNVQYQGRWNTAEDKLKAPENIRERIDNVNFNYKNHNIGFPKKIREDIR